MKSRLELTRERKALLDANRNATYWGSVITPRSEPTPTNEEKTNG